MDLRRVESIPDFVFDIVDRWKAEAAARGEAVVDFGIGSPDVGTAGPVVDRLVRAARDPGQHGYPTSAGLPQLRAALAAWYERRYGVVIDPASQALVTWGASEALDAPALGTSRAWGHGPRARSVLPHSPLRGPLQRRHAYSGAHVHARRRGPRLRAGWYGRDPFRPPRSRVRGHEAAATRGAPELSSQSDDPLRRADVHGARRAFRPSPRCHRRPRLRVRRHSLRRLPAAQHPAGARRRHRERGARLALEEPRHGRLATRLCRRLTETWWPVCGA